MQYTCKCLRDTDNTETNVSYSINPFGIRAFPSGKFQIGVSIWVAKEIYIFILINKIQQSKYSHIKRSAMI